MKTFRSLLSMFVASVLLACSTSDDNTGDSGSSNAGGDAATQPDQVGALPATVVGRYDLVSVTVDGNTLGNQNQDVEGSLVRIGGELELTGGGRYTLLLETFRDDARLDSLRDTGTWSADSTNVTTVSDSDPEGDVTVSPYTFDEGLGRLTLQLADVGVLVFQKTS